MKLDVNVLRYLEKDTWRTLTAVEMGMRNHELVPVQLIESIAGLKHGGTYKQLRELLRNKLIHHENKQYDGYRLTYTGYDFLAIRTLLSRGAIVGMGRQVGVGKEADIFEVINEDGDTLALKLHRLGRTSFRAVKNKRDYLKHRTSFNWLYLSRLAALKEFTFMRALHDNGFVVPTPVECNRHAVLMSMVPAFPFTQIKELQNPGYVFNQAMGMLVRLAQHGLIHCDLNEFNLLIDDDEKLTMIDFPQMVSVSHPDAHMYFERDAECLRIYFCRKFHLSEDMEELNFRPNFQELGVGGSAQLDTALKASGFTKESEAALLKALAATCEEGKDEDEDEEEDEDEDNVDDEEVEEGVADRPSGISNEPTSTSGGDIANQPAAIVKLECVGGDSNDEDLMSEEDSDEEDEDEEEGEEGGDRPPRHGPKDRPASGRAPSGRRQDSSRASKARTHLKNKKQGSGFRKSNRNKLVGKEKGNSSSWSGW